MNFVDLLRAARESRVAVLHEFWTQYDPRQRRVHAFFEGHDDVAFFAPHIERLLPAGYRLLRYRCEGKSRVFEAFGEVTGRQPDAQLVLFFVDKDLDDVLGIAWPTDPRIFVTDVYSVENYLVSVDVVLRLYRDGVKLTGVTFDEAVIASQFEMELVRFHRQLSTVMAWVLLARRAGVRPNLNNVNIGAMWRVTDGGEFRAIIGRRLKTLTQSTGVHLAGASVGRVREVLYELARMPAKRVLRGKYEVWFLVQFWRHLTDQIKNLAKESGGKVKVRVNLTPNTVVPTVASYVDTPRALELFLRAHLSTHALPSSGEPAKAHPTTWWQRMVTAFTGWRFRS